MKRIIEKALAGLILCLPLVFLLSCKKPTEPDTTPGFSISVEDVSCIEAWVRVKSEGLKLPADIIITKNDAPALTFTMTTTDTVVMIDSLQPKQTYILLAYRSDNLKTAVKSECTTMDTTSHNFTWQTWTFGEFASCTLYDVTIIDEDNIWAVGEIFMNDSLGNLDPTAYNAVHWDGKKWKVERIYYVYNGMNFFSQLYSTTAFSLNDLWVGSNQPMRWVGSNWQKWDLQKNVWSGWINKMWGASSNDIYLVGHTGNISHYNGSSWKKIESGTQAPINDIYGVSIPSKNIYRAFFAVSFFWDEGDRKILTIDKSGKIDSINWNRNLRVVSVWSPDGVKVFAAGDGVFENARGYWREQSNIPPYFMRSIRGNALNDIIVAGDFGGVAHYNGIRWKSFTELLINGLYNSIAIKKNLVLMVGSKGEKAIIVRGKRN